MGVSMASERLSCLLDIERCETLTLAAHVRYVRTMFSERAVLALLEASSGDLGLSLRLDARAREIERLMRTCVVTRRAAAADPFAPELFGPMSTLVEGFQMRAVGLEQAAEQAEELGQDDVAGVLRRQLRQTEYDGRLVLAATMR